MSRILFVLALYTVLTFNFSGGTFAQTEPESESIGVISGYVVAHDGGTLIGNVRLWNESSTFFDYSSWLNDTEGFTFTELEPGFYFLGYFELGEMLLGETVEVDLTNVAYAEVKIEVPYTVVGAPCEDKLDLGIDGYYDKITQAYIEFSGFSGDVGSMCEAGQDSVALQYGKCIAEYNDKNLNSMRLDDRWLLSDVRATLARYDEAYWQVVMTGGTGAGHLPCRLFPVREEFIRELIERSDDYSFWDDPLDTEQIMLVEAVTIDLNRFQEAQREMLSDGFWTFWESSCDELEDLTEDVIDIIDDLPPQMQFDVAEFLNEHYLPDEDSLLIITYNN